MAQVFPVTPLLEMFHNFAFDKAFPAAYTAIKGIQEVVKHHSKEEFDPHFSSTMTILLLVSIVVSGFSIRLCCGRVVWHVCSCHSDRVSLERQSFSPDGNKYR